MELTTTKEQLVKDYLKEIYESEELRINMVNRANNSKIEVTIPSSAMKLIITENASGNEVHSTEIVDKSLVQEIKEQTIREDVTYILHMLGVPNRVKGHNYLREAILMSIENVEILNSLRKNLYPKLAEKFQTTPGGVERTIRYAIETSWNRGCVEEIEKMFGYTVSDIKMRPTNTEFLAVVVDHFRLKYKII